MARRPALATFIGLSILLGLGLALWLGPVPTAHHATRFEAEKVAVANLLQPGEREHIRIESKLVRQWQLTLLSPNDGGNVWSNDLLWLVLIPGGHFAASGPCCVPPPTFSWNIAVINDNPGGTGLDGVIAGPHGDGPLWYRFLPDLAGAGQ